uniref:Si:ch73-217n20.1 n=1 Tax=Cyclopterus lumpus TaxID=8103 RepID=A0A8C2WPP8_CYCLU
SICSQVPNGCSAPPKYPNSRLLSKYTRVQKFSSGQKVYHDCAEGFTPARGSRVVQCVGGKWTHLTLKCERKLCGSAGEIINGLFTYTGVEFGDTATAVCDEGHRLVGRATRNCLNKGWDGRVPACEAVVCAEPPAATNAEMTELQEPPYTYRTVIRYRCPAGTLIGQRNIWCTESGTWSDPAPKCKDITCPAPKVANAYWTGGQAMYKDQDTISIECYAGFTMTGPSTVSCGGDGQWSPGLPKCTRK